ncbi:hypothetical protein FVER53590_07629 [Fusarium verticillioides]|nr:hypothetical protein FVER53263_07629 [Fusarium verticillioides]RBR06342.1 hypothetical protein FVER53590_07629 [Fusarium verticillioides]
MDWSPSKLAPKELPRVCMEDYDPQEHTCNHCDDKFEECYAVNIALVHRWYSDINLTQGDERMGDLLHRFIKHIMANRNLSKKAYESNAKTIRLRKKANRAIASHHESCHLANPEDRHAEQQNAIAMNTLACLIDISNSQRIQAQCAIINTGSISFDTIVPQMPARLGPEKMPAECLGDLSSDSEEDEKN